MPFDWRTGLTTDRTTDRTTDSTTGSTTKDLASRRCPSNYKAICTLPPWHLCRDPEHRATLECVAILDVARCPLQKLDFAPFARMTRPWSQARLILSWLLCHGRCYRCPHSSEAYACTVERCSLLPDMWVALHSSPRCRWSFCAPVRNVERLHPRVNSAQTRLHMSVQVCPVVQRHDGPCIVRGRLGIISMRGWATSNGSEQVVDSRQKGKSSASRWACATGM